MPTNSNKPIGSARQQYHLLATQTWRDQFSDPSRLVSPILFGVVITVIFAFAFGYIAAEWAPRFFAAQLSLIVLLASQMSLAQSLDTERQDFVYTLMRTYPIRPIIWYWAKLSALFVTGMLLTLPLIVATVIIYGLELSTMFQPTILLSILLAILGMTALGVLLAAMTLQAQGRQILYALLFFPLCTPVVIGFSQAMLCCLGVENDPSMLRSWLGLLLGFDVIYAAIGSVLFAELTDSD